MTDDEREALRQMAMAAKERAGKATDPEWYWWMSERPPFQIGNQDSVDIGIQANCIADADFVASARQGVPALASAVLRLLEETGQQAARIAELERQLADETKRADDWCEEAQRRWCQKCKHPHGPVAMPQGWQQMGEVVYTCPCDCHADVPALRRQLAEAVAALEMFGEDGCPGKDAEWCQCAYCAARRIVRRARAAQRLRKEGV